MDIQLVPATGDHILAIANCAQRAFADDEFEHAIFPKADAPPGSNPNVEFRVDRIRQHLQSPNRRYVIATVPSSPDASLRIAGYSAWTTPHSHTEPEPAENSQAASEELLFPRGMDMKAAEYANDAIEKAKKETLGPEENDVWYLTSLAVDPDFQGRGIASKLVQWGLDQADRAGKAAYLESSPAAVGVYRRLGFKELGKLSIIKNHDGHLATLMKREPVSA